MAVKFTEKAEHVLLFAGEEAKKRHHNFVGSEHILYALLHEPENIAVQALSRLDVDPSIIKQKTVCAGVLSH